MRLSSLDPKLGNSRFRDIVRPKRAEAANKVSAEVTIRQNRDFSTASGALSWTPFLKAPNSRPNQIRSQLCPNIRPRLAPPVGATADRG